MTIVLVLDNRPLTEAEFLAICETPERIELFDGSLYITADPAPLHQHFSAMLAMALRPAAERAGLHVLRGANVRLRPNRVPIPDLVLTAAIDFGEPVVDGSAVRLVCEVLSPHNAAIDRVLKMHYYAAAGIPWYLLVDPNTGTLQLFELVGEIYKEHSAGTPGVPLRLSDPVVVSIDPAELLPPS
ncbi:Uma2 family endonuclease [Actinoplanes sp. GCM10030250]|uniref:Uma2 family endonuclease n=1 Tax=Actinoplanes sp. GCM10030250 TaxID=3273376 RepID=UPI003609B07C